MDDQKQEAEFLVRESNPGLRRERAKSVPLDQRGKEPQVGLEPTTSRFVGGHSIQLSYSGRGTSTAGNRTRIARVTGASTKPLYYCGIGGTIR
jgi:hypothetical protein